MARHAADSSLACASAPVDADATTVAADRDSRRPAPRSAESDSPTLTAVIAGHLVDRFSACARAWCESRPDPRSTTQTLARAANARTNASVRWTPCPLPRGLDFAASVPGRTARPARDA